ncbi:MAG TPA: hypothetical protein VGO11_09100 [Chthoniobacteraceae bacterium]|jgi:hypothetical protein|nr:hypothetical protein [Chthoniobacteraceae bacterium]
MIIPIQGSTLPAAPDLLRDQIDAGWRALDLVPRAVSVSAPAWPTVADLKLDLSGAAPEKLDEFPRTEGPAEGTLYVERLLLEARPLILHGLPLSVEISALSAMLQMTSLSGDHHALVLQKAADGSVELSAENGELEKLAHTLVAAQAKKHGLDVKETHLAFTQRGPRSLSFQGDVTAKIMIMKAHLTVSGDLDLDDTLQLRISNLRLTGGGMAATLARGFLQPQFDKLEAKPISLGALTLGEIRLRDVAVSIEGETVRIRAKFGS